MARFIVTSMLVVAAVAFAAAAVEGRDVSRKLLSESGGSFQLRPIDGANSINASVSNVWINRRLLGDAARMLTGVDECQRTCDQVKHKAICRSLTHLPGVTTPQALLQAAFREAIVKAKLAKGRVYAYAATYRGGNPMASMLSTCSEAYGDAADTLAETQRLVDGGRVTGYDLNMKLSAAVTSAGDCNEAFDERPEITSPFLGTMKNTYRVVDTVLNIAYVVKKA